MSGFVGFTGGIDGKEAVVGQMADMIKHRQPEHCGSFSVADVTVAFRRPDASGIIFNEDRSITAVLDGEIYNRVELRELLTEKGHVFFSDLDTEIVVHMYEEYGAQMADKLNGVFAFAVYDTKADRLFAARDKFGVKPFYYTVANGHFLFASEIKCFLKFPLFNKELNELALEHYLTFQYSVTEETFFKGVFRLLPAHCIVVEDGKITDKQRYWKPEFAPQDAQLNKTVSEISAAVEKAVAEYTADCGKEIGSFLSSGVDSSYIAALFPGEKTFTIGFSNEEYNETTYAENLCKTIGKQNFNRVVSAREYWDALPKAQYHMDEPLADPAAIALYFASRLAAEHGVKTVLSGEGADEFFGGYNIYKEPLSLAPVTRLPMRLRKFLGALFAKIPFGFKGKNYFIRAGKTVEERFIGNANIFTKKEREAILLNPQNAAAPSEITRPFYNEVKHLDDVTKMQYIDINLWCAGDILLKADRMTAAHSIKVRSPLMDIAVFNLAAKLPTNLKVTKKTTKHAFRLAAAQKLPPETASKKKLGFPVPIRVWLRDDKYYNIVRARFESDAAKRFFKTDELIKLLTRHKSGKADNSRKIWTVYMFLVWHGVYF